VTLKYYDREGKIISQEDWAIKFQNYLYKIVRKSEILDLEVSTVWLGTDFRLNESGPPIIFETMVFGSEGTVWEDYQARYETEEEAVADHERIVRDILPVKVLSGGLWRESYPR